MLPKRVVCAVALFLVLAVQHVAAERILVLKIGPTWPKELRGSEKPTGWDASIMMGRSVDRKIAFGGGIDFLWNVNDETEPVDSSKNKYREISSQRRFMFPVSGYLEITPMPDLVVQPCISGQVGLNTMVYSFKDSIEGSDSDDESGLYMGFYWKVAADAIYSIGEKSGLFAGIDFQWSKPKKVKDEEEEHFRIQMMYGVGIRMGLRVLY